MSFTGDINFGNDSYPDPSYYDPGNYPVGVDYFSGEGQDGLLFDGMKELNIVRILICAIGVTANIIAIFMIIALAEFRKSITAWYILQLALADSIFLLTLPFKIVEDARNSWDFPEWMCQGNQSILFINYYCSVTFLTIMAIDRYIAICHSFSETLQKFRTHKSAYITTSIVWIVAILICIPIMLYSVVEGTQPNCRCSLDFAREPVKEKNFTKMCLEDDLSDYDGVDECAEFLSKYYTDESCKPTPDLIVPMAPPPPDLDNEVYINVGCHHIGSGIAYQAFIYFNFIVMFIVPFLIITTCYALIIRHLIKSSFKRTESRSSSSRDDKNRNNRVAIMCATLVAVFVCCWLPYHAVNLAKMNGIVGSSEFCSRLFHATSLLVFVNSAVNPFIYFIVARFRSSCKRVKKYRAASAVISLFTRNAQPKSNSENTKNTERKSDVENVVTATTCVNGTSV